MSRKQQLPTSIERPAWAQYNLCAFQDLHHYENGKYVIRQEHFVQTQGFAVISDLCYFQNGDYAGEN